MIVALHVPGMRVVLIGQNVVVSAGFKWLAPIVSHSRQQLASTVKLTYLHMDGYRYVNCFCAIAINVISLLICE